MPKGIPLGSGSKATVTEFYDDQGHRYAAIVFLVTEETDAKNNSLEVKRLANIQLADGTLWNASMLGGPNAVRVGLCAKCVRQTRRGLRRSMALVPVRSDTVCRGCRRCFCNEHISRCRDGRYRCWLCRVKYWIVRSISWFLCRTEEV